MMKRFDVFDVVVYYSTCLALGYAVEGYIVLAIEYSSIRYLIRALLTAGVIVLIFIRDLAKFKDEDESETK